jgi:4-hydroxybenzoate polyprenyltransferase
MFMALVGAAVALLTLGRLQDRQIDRLTATERAPASGG